MNRGKENSHNKEKVNAWSNNHQSFHLHWVRKVRKVKRDTAEDHIAAVYFKSSLLVALADEQAGGRSTKLLLPQYFYLVSWQILLREIASQLSAWNSGPPNAPFMQIGECEHYRISCNK